MSDKTCPLCGGELTDIRGEQAKIAAAAGTEWVCREMREASGRHGLECRGCGARGRYDGRGEPVAKEPDSARLDGMRGRLIDALAATSDRDRVERLAAGHLTTLQMWEADDWFPCDDQPLWCEDHERFEEDMRDAEDALSGGRAR